MRRYDYKNHALELKGSKGTVYSDNKLLFRGDGYIAIKMFIEKSNNDPNVIKIFKSQLDMREDCKYKLQDEILKRKKEEKKMVDNMTPIKKEAPKSTKGKKKVDKLFR